ncbi:MULTISPECIES: LuxR family transcriptional regulator [unclassified Mycobacterium]|uniref:helix-turn-helix transcriptional regulator n=1 Tax=unclassified Mycobacterium TaxID=2642494 RepID=UPI000801D42F|nr:MULTISPECIES: LuxR family transcriptional regulator [unclassified Mycobacterium]OBI17967.1 hypothetical protein A5713_19150 [Mycobacterium sp. E2497]
MAGPVVSGSRAAEAEAVSEFLDTCRAMPACLLVEGEAGIGKTTLWLAATEQARAVGMRVLTARAAITESVTAYVSLADLFSSVDREVIEALPGPQRLAVDQIMLQVSDDGRATDQRAVAAAFLSAIDILAETTPVLLAVDDLQWLDPSSARVVAFAARRFSGPVGLLATVRTGGGDDVSWLQLERPDAIRRIALKPLALGALRQIITARLGRSVSRHTMLRIHEASGGNPFYAIELARTIPEGEAGIEMTLPTTLAGLVASKIDVLDEDTRQILLAAACLAEPTVEAVAQAAAQGVDECVRRLLVAEERGIVTIDRHRLRFTHPLLTAAVYTMAAPTQRRAMHRRLASIVDHPELRARHLALAATHGDAKTLEALDAAAELANRRGAPAAAAEFTELANELGVGSPERQIRCATFYFSAGDAVRARDLLEEVIRTPAPAKVHAEALSLLGLWALLDGSSREGARQLQRAADSATGDDELLAYILALLAFARINIHEFEGAVDAADEAVTTATRLDDRQLLSQASSMRVLVRFLVGEGFDEEGLRTALLLDDGDDTPSAMLWPTLQHAALLNGTGRLDEARQALRAIRQRYIERGAESEMMVGAFHGALNEIWRGDFAEASLIGEDALQRARQLDADLPLAVALMIQAMVAAYAGDEAVARRDASAALTAAERCDSPALVTVWPTSTLGFLEVSLGNYESALRVLSPLLRGFEQSPRATEIFITPFLPDAAEALIRLDRFTEAKNLIDVLEDNGRRLDRPWMLAVGARCRAMLLAGDRDLTAALTAAQRAMAAHERLPMPFERGRTQLLLGDILRRQRSRENAAAAMRAAAATFEDLGTPLWERRARTSLERINFGPADSKVLTSAERRIADLAAAGRTNHDIASALFISPKTVEVHLSRIYRKLGIRSRAELGRRLDQLERDD